MAGPTVRPAWEGGAFNAGVSKSKAMLQSFGRTATGTAKQLRNFFILERAGTLAKQWATNISMVNDNLIKYENTLKAVNDTQQESVDQFEFLIQEAKFLGTDVGVLAESWGKLRAATRAAGVSVNDTKAIFQSLAETSRVLNLSSDDLEGSFRAVIQMFSKGRIQAEELRGQLGDRLVGAFQLTAEAMGKNTEELEDLMKAGKLSAKDV